MLYKIAQNGTFTTMFIYILQLKLTLGAYFIKPHKKRLSLGPDKCYTTNYILEFFNFFSQFPKLDFSFAARPTIPI